MKATDHFFQLRRIISECFYVGIEFLFFTFHRFIILEKPSIEIRISADDLIDLLTESGYLIFQVRDDNGKIKVSSVLQVFFT